MPDLACEICEKASASDDGVWRLCPDCLRLYMHFLEWVRKHPEMKAPDLEGLKEALRTDKKHSLEITAQK
ncbi:MAG TPA: hypothetical protein VJZ75_00015 [Candidatus Bathyarchaeia archaeon]|nr:hypothetical protein [Candidatus Bathyarchaeia archaeon]